MMDNSIEDICWSVQLNHEFKEKLLPFTMPKLKQAIAFLPLSLRYLKYHRDCKKKNIQAHMDFFAPIECKQIYGAPIGGIGSGSIGRSFSGDFCRFQLVPGLYEHNTAETNFFTVNIRKNSKTVYQQALVTRRPKSAGLKFWNMAYHGENATYHALYPQSWTRYNLPGQNVRLTCHQLSPIIPHDYKDSSLPLSLFDWTIENNNREEIELSLMFTWQSGTSGNQFVLTDVKSLPFKHNTYGKDVSGVVLNQKLKNMNLEYSIGVKNENCEISYDCQFYPEEEDSGFNLWCDLLEDGRLNNKKFETSKSKSSRMAIAVCAQIKVKALSKSNIEFSLVWNMPNVVFGDKSVEYKRFYTRYFPVDDTDSVKNLACYSIAKKDDWIKAINDWQNPIIHNKSLPLWYKRVVFNELYFIADGGTVWFDVRDDINCKHELVKEYGRFAYLEGHEYRMYNTYDVHFNASFALLKLWPKLQLSLQYEFSDTIEKETEYTIQFLFDGKYGKQKSKNSLPHDVGDPHREPWLILNAYNSHDTRDWKDLNLKFILSVYRDYYHLKDKDFLVYMWPFIKNLMVTIQSQDHDNDGLIDSEGWPDQTYDAWSVTGASAYCGGLHVATLKVVCTIAQLLEDDESFRKYSLILEKAKQSYDSKLWNGKYYKYDCSNSNYNDSIMSDMCCGHWYLRSSGFKYEIFEKEKIKSCLETIFEYNVMKYGDGKAGAVNGMRPNGEVDETSMQSEEMWVGITNSLASLMIYEGMDDRAWQIIEGMYTLLYNKLGLAFQTPEALFKKNVYRSLGYMRPLSIWSIQYALDELKQN